MTSTVEPESVSYFQVAMRKPTGHPPEGSGVTVEGRKEADKCELEDPCSRLITNQSPYSMTKADIMKL